MISVVFARSWNNSSLTRWRKLEIYRALVESRLLYGLTTACFTRSELRRLDQFQAKCLRSILGVPPSSVSRISNAEVRSTANWKPASQSLLEQQRFILERVIASGDDSVLCQLTFVPGTNRAATDRYIRRVGWLRLEFVISVLRA